MDGWMARSGDFYSAIVLDMVVTVKGAHVLFMIETLCVKLGLHPLVTMSENSEEQLTAFVNAASPVSSLPLLARMLRHLSPESADRSELSEGTSGDLIFSKSNPRPNTGPDPTPAHPHIADIRPHISIRQSGLVPSDATRSSSYPGRGLSAGDATPDFYGSPPLRRAG